MGAIITALTVWRLVNLPIKGPRVQKGSHVGIWRLAGAHTPTSHSSLGQLGAPLPRPPSPRPLPLTPTPTLEPGLGPSPPARASPAAPRTGADMDLLHPGVHHGLLALQARRALVGQEQRARGGAAPCGDARGGRSRLAAPRGRGGRRAMLRGRRRRRRRGLPPGRQDMGRVQAVRGTLGVRRGLLGLRRPPGASAAAVAVGVGGVGRTVRGVERGRGVGGLAGGPRRVVGGGGLTAAARVGELGLLRRQVLGRGRWGLLVAGTPARAAVSAARAAVLRVLLEGRELGLDVVGVYQKRAHGH